MVPYFGVQLDHDLKCALKEKKAKKKKKSLMCMFDGIGRVIQRGLYLILMRVVNSCWHSDIVGGINN